MKRSLLIVLLLIGLLLASAAMTSAQSSSAWCGGAPPTRLIPGEQGRVTPGLPNVIRSQPYRGAGSEIVGQIPAGGVFTVLAGYAAQCGDGMWWYLVNYNNIVGWTPEGSATGVYWTEPVSYMPTPPNCPLTPRLYVGGQGRITPGLPNVLRTQPFKGWGSNIIGLIPAGGIFTVQNGPSCANGINWWLVSYNGITGWTGEGEYSTYWAEPYTGGGNNGCTPSLPAHLTVGASAFVPNGFGTALYSSASHASAIASMPGGSWLRVISGPTCAEGTNWYQVNWQGITGWLPEAENGHYTVDPFVCGGFMPSRLVPGINGRVTPGTPNNLRSGPSLTDRVIGVIPGGHTFNIIGGPYCNNNGAWWQVQYNGITGWTMEGQHSTYWLEPQ